MFDHEIDRSALQSDLETARYRLRTLERAPGEGRWVGDMLAWHDRVANQKARILFLERELAELEAKS